MKLLLSIILTFIIFSPILASRNEENKEILLSLGFTDLPEGEAIDTVFNHLGYHVHLTKNGAEIDHVGINLFNDDIKASIDKDMLDFVEAALLSKILGIELNPNTDFSFRRGNISDLKEVCPDTPCTISNLNSRFLSFEWVLNPDKTLRLDVPISYETLNGSSRGEIEASFIKKIKNSHMARTTIENIPIKEPQPYGKDLYIIPGKTYLNKDINRNIYLKMDSIDRPIWSMDYPTESISNLFLYPSNEYGSEDIEITVLKHEYGETETFNTTIENLLAVCEEQGCIPYWGFERNDGDILSGSLFLYNWKHGYDHVFKIECNPKDVINNNGILKARASLYIPTNNIDTLYEPYRKKSDDEKIRYWED